jgi:hypothetical protein
VARAGGLLAIIGLMTSVVLNLAEALAGYRRLAREQAQNTYSEKKHHISHSYSYISHRAAGRGSYICGAYRPSGDSAAWLCAARARSRSNSWLLFMFKVVEDAKQVSSKQLFLQNLRRGPLLHVHNVRRDGAAMSGYWAVWLMTIS